MPYSISNIPNNFTAGLSSLAKIGSVLAANADLQVFKIFAPSSTQAVVVWNNYQGCYTSGHSNYNSSGARYSLIRIDASGTGYAKLGDTMIWCDQHMSGCDGAGCGPQILVNTNKSLNWFAKPADSYKQIHILGSCEYGKGAVWLPQSKDPDFIPVGVAFTRGSDSPNPNEYYVVNKYFLAEGGGLTPNDVLSGMDINSYSNDGNNNNQVTFIFHRPFRGGNNLMVAINEYSDDPFTAMQKGVTSPKKGASLTETISQSTSHDW